MSETPHYHGHRKRLRERFAKGGAEALAEYELLELLLFSAVPRGDVKPLAKALLAPFGTLGAVLAAEPQALKEVSGVGDATVHVFRLAQAVSLASLRERVVDRPVIGSWQALLDYCSASLSHSKTEHFHVLFLDNRNTLIADERQQRGTVDHVPLYPREVIKRALDLGASAIVLVHNHPSGDPTPSQADIDMTHEVQEAGKKLGVTVHDHLIIGRNSHQSFRSLGLI